MSSAINMLLGNSLKEQIADMKKVVNELPSKIEPHLSNISSGIPAPSLADFSAESVNNGVNITYKAIGSTVLNNDNHNVAATTKGVMVRYSDSDYPTSIKDGTLAFVDEDLFNLSGGVRIAKTKTRLVEGLSNETRYFFTAFPFTHTKAYNESMGELNTTPCRFMGTKGRIFINVNANDKSKISPFTITATPKNGGNTATKQMSNLGNTHMDLEKGVWIISLSALSGYFPISNKEISVVAGMDMSIDFMYEIKVSLSSLSWSKIDEISRTGKAQNAFSVGNTKDITVDGETLTMEIVGFNHDDLASGGKAGITFGMKNLMKNNRNMSSSNTNSGGAVDSALHKYINSNIYNNLPADLKAVIKKVKKKTTAGGATTTLKTYQTNLFLFSVPEVFQQSEIPSWASKNDGYLYPRFTNNTSRVKKMSNGTDSAAPWWLGSPDTTCSDAFCYVSSDGSIGSNRASGGLGVCFGFCI